MAMNAVIHETQRTGTDPGEGCRYLGVSAPAVNQMGKGVSQTKGY